MEDETRTPVEAVPPDYQMQAARYKRILVQAVGKLSRLYSDQTHFIYELVQNADDVDSPTLHFLLRADGLRVWNRGRVFTVNDIEGICSVDESTKDLTQIGTHGIGFKAVYIWTDAPEIYSGPHRFRIQDYVDKVDVVEPAVGIGDLMTSGCTVFELPFKAKLDTEKRGKLSRQLRHIHPWTLLFLHELREITWQDECETGEGRWQRSSKPHARLGAAQVVKLTQGAANEQPFLVFTKAAVPPQDVIIRLLGDAETQRERERIESSGRKPQPIEIAFTLHDGAIQPQEDSVLFSYLPTEIQTGLRFMVQARYQTTPARDNIAASRDSAWNEWLIRETAGFMPSVLEQLRAAGLLTPTVFETLPNGGDKAKIADSVRHVFEPIYMGVLVALCKGAFVPTNSGRFSPSAHVFFPHREELANVLSAADLSSVAEAQWLHPGIVWSGRAGTLLREAGVMEIGVKQVLRWLALQDAAWFEARDAEWLNRLYRYLVTQKPEWPNMKGLPLVRLRDGSHVAPANRVVFFTSDGDEGDTLLSSFMEGLPILSAVIDLSLASGDVQAMLAAWGIRAPKPGDVIEAGLLPEHRAKTSFPAATLHSHLHLMVTLMARLTEAERQRLLPNIKSDFWLVASAVADPGGPVLSKAAGVYLPQSFTGSADLERYFQQSPATLFLHPGYVGIGLDREAAIKVLREIGVADLPRHIQSTRSPLTEQEEGAIRGQGKTAQCLDWHLDGLPVVLDAINVADDPDFDLTRVLWRVLQRIKARRNAQLFVAKYRWQWQSLYEREVDPTFLRQLKASAWLPDEDGTLRRPENLRADTSENRKLLGGVFYLHYDFDLTDAALRTFAGWLGITLTATPAGVFQHLGRLVGHAGDPSVTEPLYGFLARQEMATVRTAFDGKPWIFSATPEAAWRTTDQVFWKNESAVFGNQWGYLEGTYSSALKPFFATIGVSPEATLTHYLSALEEISHKGWTDEGTRRRLQAIYRRIWHYLQACEGNLEEPELGHWKRVASGRTWLGQRGVEWGFYNHSGLVVADVEYVADLFTGHLPFWGFKDLNGFAEDCGVERCSVAIRSFQPLGENKWLVDWSHRISLITHYVRAFLHPQSTKLSGARNTNADPALLDRIAVHRTENARVEYALKRMMVEDATPSPSYLDPMTATLWIMERVDVEDYPDLIGDALQDLFGTTQLSHFVSQLLSCNESRLNSEIQRWQRKGLNLRATPTSGEAGDALNDADLDLARDADLRPKNVEVLALHGGQEGWHEADDTQGDNGEEKALLLSPLVASVSDMADFVSDTPPAADAGGLGVPLSQVEAAEPVVIIGTSGSALSGGHPGVPNAASPTAGRSLPHGHFTFGSIGGGGSREGSGGHGSVGGPGGESPSHIALKMLLARNPSLLGQDLALVQVEYSFASLDKADILFMTRDGSPVTVEVETHIPDGNYVGVWQAVKYQHLAAMQFGRDCRSVRTVVVAPSFPENVLDKCRELGVEWFVQPIPVTSIP